MLTLDRHSFPASFTGVKQKLCTRYLTSSRGKLEYRQFRRKSGPLGLGSSKPDYDFNPTAVRSRENPPWPHVSTRACKLLLARKTPNSWSVWNAAKSSKPVNSK